MKRIWVVAAAAALLGGLAQVPMAAASPKAEAPRVTRESFRITSLQSIDLGAPGGSAVTQLVYSGDLSAKDQQGQFGGSCILVSPAAYQCAFIGVYPDGQLVHEGIVDATALTSPSPDFVLATTGGTGIYRGSRGEIRVHRTGTITEGAGHAPVRMSDQPHIGLESRRNVPIAPVVRSRLYVEVIEPGSQPL
jgi:hypothetical protein